MKIVILGLSITSSWGNGHATTYRGLVRELVQRGHEVLFLERDQPWYADHRDLPAPPFGETHLYQSMEELQSGYGGAIREADFVMVGSFVPEGAAVGEWVTTQTRSATAFYDIDTPVTLAKLASGDCDYLSSSLIPRYALYLSFTGGPTLQKLQTLYGSPRACPLYCSVDPALYYPEPASETKWALGYLGTYSEDRQAALEHLLLEPASMETAMKLVVAGSLYPETIHWPANVERITHLAPAAHRKFYNSQRFTLNITRAEMVRAGYSPSVRLFEAAACGTPIISDPWEGLDEFFVPGEEILIAESASEVVKILRDVPEHRAREIGQRARQRVLAEHTAAHRAAELEALITSDPFVPSDAGERAATLERTLTR